MRYSKTCIIHKANLRIDWEFWNKLILSSKLVIKNYMLGSQNGPLKWHNQTFCISMHGQKFEILAKLSMIYLDCCNFVQENLWENGFLDSRRVYDSATFYVKSLWALGKVSPGGWGWRVLKYISYMGMCRPNGSFFHKKSLDMGPLLRGKTLSHGSLFSKMFKIFGVCHPCPNQIWVPPSPVSPACFWIDKHCM